MTDMDQISLIVGFVWGFGIAMIINAINELRISRHEGRELVRVGKKLLHEMQEIQDRIDEHDGRVRVPKSD